MNRLNPLVIMFMLVLTTGCGRFGQKLLGTESSDPEPQSPVLIYTQSGKILGDFMVYGDQEFRRGRYVTVEVCTEEWTNCQFLPRRTQETTANKSASYLWVRDGVWITYVSRSLIGIRRWKVRVYA